jgi:hypothetical protein
MKTKMIALSMLCVLAGVGVAVAQQRGASPNARGEAHGECDHHGGPGRGHGHMLKKMDTNSDGRITREEFNAHTQERFKHMDKNNDGVVTEEEIRALHAEHGRGHGRGDHDRRGNHEGRARGHGPASGGMAGSGG